MNNARRTFVAAGAAALALSPVAATWGEEKQPEAAKIDGLTCLDYGRSFICNTASFNAVRFWVESRTVLIDGEQRFEFYQCGSCKSENTFGKENLFLAENYDFLPILGDGYWLVFRRTAKLNPTYRSFKKIEDIWGPANLKLREARKLTVLDSFEQIRDATAAATPLVSRTEIQDENTGPVALPDLSKRYEPRIDSLRLAFVAFNAPHFADFVIEQPTKVIEEEQEKCQIHHYSGPISLKAKNTLLAVGDA
ncbi:MAG: hypothetical protein K8R36_14090 [Planctomycetales bacterium]|nr:hypothetical protein [Planctomycetales bacterium]